MESAAEPSIISLLCGTADSSRSRARTNAPLIPDVFTIVLRFLAIRDILTVAEGIEIEALSRPASEAVIFKVVEIARLQSECYICGALELAGVRTFNMGTVSESFLSPPNLKKVREETLPVDCSVCEQRWCWMHDTYGYCNVCCEQVVCSAACAVQT